MVTTTQILRQECRKALQLCAEEVRFGVFDASGVMLGAVGTLWCNFWHLGMASGVTFEPLEVVLG